ncbi:MAG: pantoate--beta-alanine ligase, partial [Planctomycetota bacterium]
HRQNQPVVVSIFVNPTQFGPKEDFDAYPRTWNADLALCRENGAAIVFAPRPEWMYPDGFATSVHVGGVADVLEGAHRPGHFDGVATVVSLLLNVVRPSDAYFGLKDFQQFRVVAQMVRDLRMPVGLVGCETVREPDGLALSSRNRYLSAKERRTAGELPKALFAARDALELGEDWRSVEAMLTDRLATAGMAVDYAVVRDPHTLREPGDPASQYPDVQVLAAVWVGSTRLIDNVSATRHESPGAVAARNA